MACCTPSIGTRSRSLTFSPTNRWKCSNVTQRTVHACRRDLEEIGPGDRRVRVQDVTQPTADGRAVVQRHRATRGRAVEENPQQSARGRPLELDLEHLETDLSGDRFYEGTNFVDVGPQIYHPSAGCDADPANKKGGPGPTPSDAPEGLRSRTTPSSAIQECRTLNEGPTPARSDRGGSLAATGAGPVTCRRRARESSRAR